MHLFLQSADTSIANALVPSCQGQLKCPDHNCIKQVYKPSKAEISSRSQDAKGDLTRRRGLEWYC